MAENKFPFFTAGVALAVAGLSLTLSAEECCTDKCPEKSARACAKCFTDNDKPGEGKFAKGDCPDPETSQKQLYKDKDKKAEISEKQQNAAKDDAIQESAKEHFRKADADERSKKAINAARDEKQESSAKDVYVKRDGKETSKKEANAAVDEKQQSASKDVYKNRNASEESAKQRYREPGQ